MKSTMRKLSRSPINSSNKLNTPTIDISNVQDNLTQELVLKLRKLNNSPSGGSEISDDSKLSAKRREIICCSLPLVYNNLCIKLSDHLLLGEEHVNRVFPEFKEFDIENGSKLFIDNDEKREIVLADPKFGMFSLFYYHVTKGYLNIELKKSNKIFCSHIFSLTFALPILVYFTQWILYIALLSHEINAFDGDFCPNTASLENKMMMCGIGILYFVRSFFIWDNLTVQIGLKKMNRMDSISAIIDTFQEFSFNIIVYGANLWIIFTEKDLQNMILNSLAMEFLMRLDNDFEELYFKNLPNAAVDIYDTMYVSREENKKLVSKHRDASYLFNAVSCLLVIPYKILVLTIFLFPVLCFFMAIAGPLCK